MCVCLCVCVCVCVCACACVWACGITTYYNVNSDNLEMYFNLNHGTWKDGIDMETAPGFPNLPKSHCVP